MKTKRSSKSYVVSSDILPDVILKTVQVNEMLTRGDALTVNEAVEKVGISRSAFYKYKDGIQPYTREDNEIITAFSLLLEHRSGVLSTVLNTVASMKGNIDSINQSMPIQGVAIVTMNVNTTIIDDIDVLIGKLQDQEGVIKVEVVT
ncbi:MAG: ACT domain-containing protein [Clostridiales bacterium]|nr:ACT domain-containing protein [Clostridiales bacterium]